MIRIRLATRKAVAVAIGLVALLVALPVTAQARGAVHLGDRTIRVGMSGHDVRVLQSFLTDIGIKTTVDGDYGSTSASHVRSFEKKAHLRRDSTVSRRDAHVLVNMAFKAQASAAGTGGAAYVAPPPAVAPLAPGQRARLNKNGTATASSASPLAVQQIIAAGNVIAFKPYIYGGGHGSWIAKGYDCSGSVSFALHGAKLVNTQYDSTDLMAYGDSGPGQWVTIYSNPSHVYMVVAGLRYDTSGATADGSRWHSSLRSGHGYVVRHPPGL